MIFIAILIGCILGAIIGINAPMVSYTYSSYLAIAIIAALDSVFGGITSVINKNFDLKIFITGFFGNAILSILLTILGEKLNVDIYLAAIVVFVGRMFTNLAIAIIAALDSVFGGITSVINKNFDLKIFITGFFGNAILAILLTILGQKLNVDIYLAAIVVFVGRMFVNLAIIRRYYVDKWLKAFEKKKQEHKQETNEITETK